jgi:RimJ/RimL family protein N-acetyltransferase
MSEYVNELGQPIGFPMPNWQGCEYLSKELLQGQYCRLVRLDVTAHASDLYHSFSEDGNHHNWTYLPYGPFEEFDDFKAWLEGVASSKDPFFYTVINQKTGIAVGMASYLRIQPAVGSIEVGHIHFSPLMQQTPIASEAMFLMMQHVFDELGYRRYEWKCDALNEPSKKAAKRLGFSFEGVFRQATIYKQRNRDTAWLAIIDSDWPSTKSAFETWLAPENFGGQGQQVKPLNTEKTA